MDLTRRIKYGVFWVGVSTMCVRLLSFLATFILAKLLMPEEIGRAHV